MSRIDSILKEVYERRKNSNMLEIRLIDMSNYLCTRSNEWTSLVQSKAKL
jgi:hypothetical protein